MKNARIFVFIICCAIGALAMGQYGCTGGGQLRLGGDSAETIGDVSGTSSVTGEKPAEGEVAGVTSDAAAGDPVTTREVTNRDTTTETGETPPPETNKVPCKLINHLGAVGDLMGIGFFINSSEVQLFFDHVYKKASSKSKDDLDKINELRMMIDRVAFGYSKDHEFMLLAETRDGVKLEEITPILEKLVAEKDSDTAPSDAVAGSDVAVEGRVATVKQPMTYKCVSMGAAVDAPLNHRTDAVVDTGRLMCFVGRAEMADVVLSKDASDECTICTLETCGVQKDPPALWIKINEGVFDLRSKDCGWNALDSCLQGIAPTRDAAGALTNDYLSGLVGKACAFAEIRLTANVAAEGLKGLSMTAALDEACDCKDISLMTTNTVRLDSRLGMAALDVFICKFFGDIDSVCKKDEPQEVVK